MFVVLDTNVVVSAYISTRGIGPPALVLESWRRGVFGLIVTDDIFDEYDRILKQPRIQAFHGLTHEEVDRNIQRFRTLGLMAPVTLPVTAVEDDPDDDKFLSAAVASSSDFIVSGDVHLLSLRSYLNIPVVPPSVFLSILESGAR